MRTPTPTLLALLAGLAATSCTPALPPPSPVGMAIPGGASLHDVPRPANAAPATTFGGIVSFGGPVAGATVRLLDADGQPLGEPLTTSLHGGFLRTAAGLPAAFTVVVTGGKAGSQAFTGELRAAVKRLDATTDSVVVSLASTIAARALAARPDADPGALTVAASTALGMPARHAASLRIEQLDATAVVREAARAGSLDAWVEARAAELVAGRAFARSYERPAARRQVEVAIATLIGEQLAKSAALSAAATLVKSDIANILRSAGLEDRSTNDLIEDIKQLNTRLDAIQSQLDTEVAKIASEQFAAQYAAQYVTTVGPMIAFQQDTFADLTTLVAARQASTTLAQHEAASVRTAEIMAGIKAHIIDQAPWSLWQQALVSGGMSTDSLTTSFNQYVGQSAPLNGKAWGPAQSRAMTLWFDSMDAHMAHTALFLTNYYDLLGIPGDHAGEISRNWKRVNEAWMGMVRGLDKPTAVHVYGPADPGRYEYKFSSFAPAGATSFGDAGWLRPIDPYLPQDFSAFARGYTYTTAIQGAQVATGVDDWKLPTIEQLQAIQAAVGAPDVISLLKAMDLPTADAPGGQQAVWTKNHTDEGSARMWYVFLDGAFTPQTSDPYWGHQFFKPYAFLYNGTAKPCVTYADAGRCRTPLAAPTPAPAFVF